jgi:hypothetical protein
VDQKVPILIVLPLRFVICSVIFGSIKLPVPLRARGSTNEADLVVFLGTVTGVVFFVPSAAEEAPDTTVLSTPPIDVSPVELSVTVSDVFDTASLLEDVEPVDVFFTLPPHAVVESISVAANSNARTFTPFL